MYTLLIRYSSLFLGPVNVFVSIVYRDKIGQWGKNNRPMRFRNNGLNFNISESNPSVFQPSVLKNIVFPLNSVAWI